jgi:Holliday junction resolvase RusA-like endonuclease
MKLTLPLPPNRGNAREHWRVTQNRKKVYYQLAHVAIRNQTIGIQAMATGPRKVTAKLYVWGIMDRDNAVARLKWPLDALVHAGLLMDDNPQWCKLEMPTQEIDRTNRRIEFELCDVARD